MAYGDKPLGLKDLKIAAYDPSTGTYGTAVQVPQGRKLIIKPNNITSKLPGYMGRTAAVASVVVDADVTIDGGTVPKDVFAALLGLTKGTSGTTPAEETTLDIEVKKNPGYFGVIGVADDDEGGDSHFGLPLVKLTELPEWTIQNEDNLFVLSEMKGLAIADDSDKLIYLLSHETAGAADFTEIFA